MPIALKIILLFNTEHDEVRAILVLGKIALRLAGWWKTLLRDIRTETYSDANNSLTTRLR